VTEYKIAYIQDSQSTINSVKLEMCWYVNGSFHGFSDCSHVYQLLEIDGILLRWFTMHSVTPVPLHTIMELYAQPISQVICADQKQRLKNGVGQNLSVLNARKA